MGIEPISGAVGKKAADSIWDAIRKWWNRHTELEKRIGFLEAQLAEERSGTLAFENKLAELERRTGESIYWTKDNRALCPLCIESDQKFVQLVHGTTDGDFYCRLHEQTFETAERRQRRLQRPLQPVTLRSRYRWPR